MQTDDTRTRREFLAGSGAAVAALGLAPRPETAEGGATEQRKPLVVACRDTHLREVGASDSWSAMQRIGVDGVEVWVDLDGRCRHLFHPKGKYTIGAPDGVARLHEDLTRAKKRITALCMANQFDERPDEEVQAGTRWAKVAGQLGVPAIRIDVVPRRIKDPDEFLRFAVKVCKRLVQASAETNVRFAIENHGRTTNRPEFLEPLFQGVGSDRLGLTLDTGNFYWFGHPLADVYKIYRRFAPRAFHTHCKNIRYPESEREKRRPIGWQYSMYNCPVHLGDIDMRKVVAILREAGYANDLCIENESLGKVPKGMHAQVLAAEATFLRQLAG